MAPILYHQDISPPCRAVRIVADALNIPLQLKVINLLNQEHLSTEFKKINPQHTLPCLDDNGFIIWDSHAIIAYLIDIYVKEDTSLYPKDVKIRAMINQRNHFDTGILFAKLRQLYKPIHKDGEKELNPIVVNEIEESYTIIEAFLENHNYLCGNSLTVADISCATTIQSIYVAVPIPQECVKTLAWLDRVTNFPPYVKKNTDGHIVLVNRLKLLLGDKIHSELELIDESV